jgi:hypothetical protein
MPITNPPLVENVESVILKRLLKENLFAKVGAQTLLRFAQRTADGQGTRSREAILESRHGETSPAF